MTYSSETFITPSVSSGGSGVTDHGALCGLTDDDHTQYSFISVSSSSPTSTPSREGLVHIDDSAKDVYVSAGTSTSSDWIQVNVSGGTVDFLSNVATGVISGRITAGSGNSEELTPAQVRTLINVEDGSTADQTAADIRGLGFFDTSNDGTGSGLDADLLDGQEGSYYAVAANLTETDQNADDLVTLTGVAENSTDLGTFTNGIIADNETIKGALQDVEDALEGSLPVRVGVHNNSGSGISKGQAIYVSGTHASGKPEISLADANGASTYPAIGLVEADIADGAEGFVVLSGLVENINTSSYSAGDGLYLSETPGAVTTTRPSASTTRVQRLGLVSRSHASAGSIIVIGAGRSNDVPNEITTLTGVALNATDLGTFTGSTITANETIKGALQDLDTKLSGIEAGATADQTDAEIKTAYENNANTNAFTDAEKTLLGNQSGTNTGDEVAATNTTAGIVEISTSTEINTGTADDKAISPLALAGSQIQTDVTANNAKVTNATHTGDVTGATALTIASNAVTTAKILDSNVTLAKLENIADDTVLGNVSGSAAAPSALSISDLQTLIGYDPNLQPKCFGSFDPTTSPTVDSNSYNVSSITRNGAGDYTINYTTALSSGGYTIMLTQGDSTATPHLIGTGTATTTTFDLFIKNASGTLTDNPEKIFFTVHQNA